MIDDRTGSVIIMTLTNGVMPVKGMFVFPSVWILRLGVSVDCQRIGYNISWKFEVMDAGSGWQMSVRLISERRTCSRDVKRADP